MPFRYDESDPNLIIAYTGAEHETSDYQELARRWIARCEKPDRFGVVIVNEPHHHDHDEDEAEHRAEEEAFVKLLNDFRRDYRALSNVKTTGFANVYKPDDYREFLDRFENGWEQMQAVAVNRAYYIFGVRGSNFPTLDEALAWLREQAALPPLDLSQEVTGDAPHPNRVGLYFGSTTGTTEKIAFDIQAAWAAAGMGELEVLNIGYAKDTSALLQYDSLIFGIPTWNIGQLQDDWEILFPQLDKLDFTGKRIALFGAGDQYGYPDNFQDALGILGHKLRERGAILVGFWDTAGYEFTDSRGVEAGQFMGLALDEIHQPALTPQRIERWVAQIMQEFSLEPAGVINQG